MQRLWCLHPHGTIIKRQFLNWLSGSEAGLNTRLELCLAWREDDVGACQQRALAGQGQAGHQVKAAGALSLGVLQQVQGRILPQASSAALRHPALLHDGPACTHARDQQ